MKRLWQRAGNTEASLHQDLAAMGLKPEDTVLVHSSMKAIGPTKGNADGVLDALSSYFEPGLLVLPALSWEWADRPRIFDVARAPTTWIGILPELFRKRPGVIRSEHPTHSVAALGRDARAFTADDRRSHSPCGRGTSWEKLIDRDAVILMVGCDLNRCTFIHGVEEWCGIDGRLMELRHFKVIPVEGEPFGMDVAAHIGTPSNQFYRAEGALRAGGAIKDGRLGQADVLVVSARRAYSVLQAVLKERPRLFDA